MTHEIAPHHDTGARPPMSGTHDGCVTNASLPIDPLVIDCDTCAARGVGCGDCVVSVLLGGPPVEVSLNEEERRAVEVLSAAGLVPPLRLVHGLPGPEIDTP